MLIFSDKLLRLALFWVLLAIPVSGLAANNSPDYNDYKIETLKRVLSQADHFRIRAKAPKQLKQALSLYQHAAGDGIAVAQYWLGVMYFKGQGTESDLEKAKYWINLSVEQSYPPAEQFLSEFLKAEEEAENDEEEEEDY